MNWKERFDERFRNEDYLCGGCGECEAYLLWAKPFKLFITQELSRQAEEIRGEVSGMKRKVEECDMTKDEHHCNACDSMMSCEYAEQTRSYNSALTDTLALLDKYISNK